MIVTVHSCGVLLARSVSGVCHGVLWCAPSWVCVWSDVVCS